MKKGQITIFIIVAIIIVGLVVLFFTIRGKTSLNIGTSQEVKPVYAYVRDCIEQTAYYGIYEIGAKGGYYFPARDSVDTGEAYYVLAKKSLIPDKETIESQLGAYIEVNLRICLDGFKLFPSFNISSGEISATTILKEDRFIVNVNYPITITQAGSVSKLSKFENIEVLTRASLLYNIASNYSNLFFETGGLSLTYASNLEDSFNIITNFQHFPDYTLVTLTDAKGIDNNSTYQWGFVLA